MLNVTHSIQATITLSTCCAVPWIERTLNLRPYHIQHSTLAISTTYLKAAHIIFRRKTQEASPNRIYTSCVPTTPAGWIYFILGISCLRNVIALAGFSRRVSTSNVWTVSYHWRHIQIFLFTFLWFIWISFNLCLILATMLLSPQWCLFPTHLQQHQVSSPNSSVVIYSVALLPLYVTANFTFSWVSDWNENCPLLQAQRSRTWFPE